jgi:anti-sigma factor ChrR (cupin superfamily)
MHAHSAYEQICVCAGSFYDHEDHNGPGDFSARRWRHDTTCQIFTTLVRHGMHQVVRT